MREERGTDPNPWKPAGKWAIRLSPYTIAKYLTPKPRYALWKDGEEKCLGYFNTADEAKEKAE